MYPIHGEYTLYTICTDGRIDELDIQIYVYRVELFKGARQATVNARREYDDMKGKAKSSQLTIR